MSNLISIDRRGAIAVVLLANPPVNTFAAPLRVALYDALSTLRDDPAIAGIVLAGAGRCFSAGAEISEFAARDGAKVRSGRDIAEVYALLDTLEKPVVAAVHGYALGGGTELALSCNYRVAAPGTLFGLPEITLGILPGAGGTQRLPRLIGLEPALRLILSGETVDAAAAKNLGLVDAVIEGGLIDGAVAFVTDIVARKAPPRRVREMAVPSVTGLDAVLKSARAEAAKKRSYALAGKHIVACVEAAVNLPFDAGIAFERAQFLALNQTDEAAALQHGFFAQREAAKIPGLPADTRERKIARIGVVGGGTMGRGIAIAIANAGLPVVLLETDQQKAEGAVQTIAADYDRLRKNGRLSDEVASARAALVTPAVGDDALRDCDLVIEAVFENLAIKLEVCRRLGAVCKSGAIIATNTSTLDVDVLAQATGRPSDVVGMHFFSPANIMKLLEVVRGAETAPDVLATVMTLARKLKKTPVVSGVCYGFIGNRMLEPYLREAEALLLEGATPSQIDRALEEFGMAMGPCRMMDLAGVDVVAKVVIERDKQGALPDDPLYRIVCRELEHLGLHGQKTAKGFYRYDGRKALDDLDAVAVIQGLAARHGVIKREAISAQEIVERCLYPLINEGLMIVEEGIAYRDSDCDVVWLAGYGFPAERGGPLFYAKTIGYGAVVERLRHYGEMRGNPLGYWTPTKTLAG